MSKNNTKTINPKLADINFASNVDLLKKYSNYLDLITGIENEIKISLDYYVAITKSDQVNSLADFFKNLDENQLPILKNDFVDFWVKRFESISGSLKDAIKNLLNINDNSFFTDLSDSVGLLLNSDNLLDDSTIPFFDYECNIYLPPNYIPLQLKNKISNTTLEVLNDLSLKNTSLEKYNLKRINLTTDGTNPYTDPTKPHGLNLITDINSMLILSNSLEAPWMLLIQKYQKIYSYINYLSNIGNQVGYNPRDAEKANKQAIKNLIFSFDIEKIKLSIDLLQRKVINILSYKTIKNTISNIETDNNANQ
jgi:hypothetical protein